MRFLISWLALAASILAAGAIASAVPRLRPREGDLRQFHACVSAYTKANCQQSNQQEYISCHNQVVYNCGMGNYPGYPSYDDFLKHVEPTPWIPARKSLPSDIKGTSIRKELLKSLLPSWLKSD